MKWLLLFCLFGLYTPKEKVFKAEETVIRATCGEIEEGIVTIPIKEMGITVKVPIKVLTTNEEKEKKKI